MNAKLEIIVEKKKEEQEEEGRSVGSNEKQM